MNLRVEKIVGALPGVITANTIYAVRTGAGFDLYVSDSTASIAHALNLPSGSGSGTDIHVGPTPPLNPANGKLWLQTL
jgi:hypothetical protein